jgi:hypothetical protein
MRSGEAWLVVGLVFASAGTVDQYLGPGGVIAYAVGAAAAVPLLLRRGLPLLLAHVDERRALALAVLTFVGIVVVFAIVYPRINVHSGFSGSDRDDASNLAARHLLHGEYPYSTRTYLGNLVSQLPGAVLLAVPFVVLGSSAYQNIFWIAVLFLALRRFLRDGRLALAALWLALLGAPGAIRELLNGGDVLANNAYLIVFSLGVLAIEPATPGRRWLRVAAAVGLGLALSSRVNVLLLVPLLFAALARREGVGVASRLVGVAVAVFVAVTLPFYAYAPSRFSPNLTAGKIGRLQSVVPGATVIVIVVVGVLTLLLAARLRGDTARVFRAFALVQAVTFGLGVLLSSIAVHGVDLGFLLLSYGLFVLFPATVAVWGEAQAT